MATLRATVGTDARMLELCILCGVRTGPVIKMKWGEVDLVDATWEVPKEHEKTFEPLRVPLSERAVAILEAQRPPDARPMTVPSLRPSAITNRQRTNVTLRRVLRRFGYAARPTDDAWIQERVCDWRAELTAFSVDLQEAALSHAIPGVRGVYQRGDLFNKRRSLMAAWASYCAGDDGNSNVMPIEEGRHSRPSRSTIRQVLDVGFTGRDGYHRLPTVPFTCELLGIQHAMHRALVPAVAGGHLPHGDVLGLVVLHRHLGELGACPQQRSLQSLRRRRL